ncbi:hypothetical protein CHARACLAT_033342 [Characodon lateralis]|uniref:Uncharacterized protein n=1 Tax=Characodon lateralis TaxID=208331 RepID=A0ABU7DC53_9TELE|nr:hypothetical protein [Characodon lateralis]
MSAGAYPITVRFHQTEELTCSLCLGLCCPHQATLAQTTVQLSSSCGEPAQKHTGWIQKTQSEASRKATVAAHESGEASKENSEGSSVKARRLNLVEKKKGLQSGQLAGILLLQLDVH